MKNIFLFFLFFLIVGCAGNPRVQADIQRRLPNEIEPRNVQIIENTPQSNYVRIGEVKVEGAEHWENVEQIFKNRAASAGGNAVVVSERSSYLKIDYNPPPYPGDAPPYYDPFGLGYTYGANNWGYRFYYPTGFYTDTDKLWNGRGMIIKIENVNDYRRFIE